MKEKLRPEQPLVRFHPDGKVFIEGHEVADLCTNLSFMRAEERCGLWLKQLQDRIEAVERRLP